LDSSLLAVSFGFDDNFRNLQNNKPDILNTLSQLILIGQRNQNNYKEIINLLNEFPGGISNLINSFPNNFQILIQNFTNVIGVLVTNEFILVMFIITNPFKQNFENTMEIGNKINKYKEHRFSFSEKQEAD
jgi:hypothetical protein